MTRLGSWRSGAGEVPVYLERSYHSVFLAVGNVVTATEDVGRMTMADWAPAPRSMAVVYEEGEAVAIGDAHRARYLQIYNTAMVDSLTVVKVLPSGQIAVRHGRKGHPFIVSKSHLKKRGRGDEGTTGRAEGKNGKNGSSIGYGLLGAALLDVASKKARQSKRKERRT